MRYLLAFFILGMPLLNQAFASPLTFYGDVIYRYEDDRNHRNILDRERIRLIARPGVKYQISPTWQANLGLSTGLKNRQNVPAITVHRFNEQPQPDSDLFIARLFVTGKWQKSQLHFGKIPWLSKQSTDIFWDRQLNPIGGHVNYKFNANHQLHIGSYLPLDGASNTVGNLHLLQWISNFKWRGLSWQFAPWYVDYRGDANAEFARRDTQFDQRSIRLAAHVKKGPYKLGIDWGRTLNDIDLAGFENEKNAFAVQFTYGSLKQVGQYQAHLRFMHVERFGAIREFAQNATARFTTSNLGGWDFRLRKRVHPQWWVGTRLSIIETLAGPKEQGARFRIEAQYKW